jgi:4-amino-4-deoxy-L-arabinose transferase-like glycosyltransferase
MGLAGNQPLWNDEVFSLAMATGHSLEQPPTVTNPVLGDFVQPNRAESPEELGRYIKHDSPPAAPGRVVRAVFLSDTSPPLYYLLLYVWTLVFGTSDAILRQFSIVCSLACLPFLAGIARRTAGPEAVLPSCLLFAFSPLGICFSTEGRMYALLWLCVISVTWLSLVWYERDQSILVPAAWVLTSAAGFLTHYFFIFPWAALVAFLLLRPEKISRIRITGCILLTALTIFPWYMRVPESLHSWRLMKDWLIWEPDGFSRLNATRTLLLQNFSGAGHHSSSNFVALAIFAIIAAAMLLRLRTKVFAGRWLLLWLLFFAPCVGVLAFDFIMHTYAAAHDRYAIAALPIGCLLAGAGLVLLPGRTRTVLLVLILVAWAPNLLISDQTTKRVTARYRAEAVSANQSPGDLVLIDAIPSGMLNIVRYLKGPARVANWSPSWLQQPATQQTPESILRLATGRSRIRWIAGAGAPPTPPERDWLRANAIASDETQIMSDFRPKNAETF